MKTTVDRVKKHRDALRTAGLRPVQIWVPDVRRRGFARECKRQSRRLLADSHEKDTLKWLGKIAETEAWR